MNGKQKQTEQCTFGDLQIGDYFRKVYSGHKNPHPGIYIKIKNEDPTEFDGWGKYKLVGTELKQECYDSMPVAPCNPKGELLPQNMGLLDRIDYFEKWRNYPPVWPQSPELKKLYTSVFSDISHTKDFSKRQVWCGIGLFKAMSNDELYSLIKNCEVVTDIEGAEYLENFLETYTPRSTWDAEHDMHFTKHPHGPDESLWGKFKQWWRK